MELKRISLRWRAYRKYHGYEDSTSLRVIRPSVWLFLESVMRGEILLNLPIGHPQLKRVISSEDGIAVNYVIGRPGPTDPDNHADYFVEDFWPDGDAASN